MRSSERKGGLTRRDRAMGLVFEVPPWRRALWMQLLGRVLCSPGGLASRVWRGGGVEAKGGGHLPG